MTVILLSVAGGIVALIGLGLAVSAFGFSGVDHSAYEVVFLAGDSSGGNLVLATIAWARDAGLRPADAVVVFSPQTDVALESPGLVQNVSSDIMQGKPFGPNRTRAAGARALADVPDTRDQPGQSPGVSIAR